jgi:hypothetical protein
MKILECDKTDCPAHSKYVVPEPPTSPSTAQQGMYHNTNGMFVGTIGGGNAYGTVGAVITGAAGMMTINGVPSYITNTYLPVVASGQTEPSIHFCFGEIKVHPACMMCSNLPKVDMRELQIAEKAKTMLER